MSWNFSAIGTRRAVGAAVEADTGLPAGIKATVNNLIQQADRLADGGDQHIKTHVRVSTHGHLDPHHGGSISKLEVEFVNLSAEPALREPAVPAAADEQPSAVAPAS